MENDNLRVKVIREDNEGKPLICNKIVLVDENGKEILHDTRIFKYIKTGV